MAMENWSASMMEQVEQYMAAVEKALQGKPEKVRQEILRGLQEHIEESLLQAGGPDADGAAESLARIIAEMDEPESFEDSSDDVPPLSPVASAPAAPAAAEGNSGWRWVWLAVACLFLLINAIGVAGYLSRVQKQDMVHVDLTEQTAGEQVPMPAPVQNRVLRLRKVEQMDISSGRGVMLKLVFNEAPDRSKLSRHLRLQTAGQGEIAYRMAGVLGETTVVVETDPVLDEYLEFVVQSGLPARDAASIRPTDRSDSGRLHMDMNMVFKGMKAYSPAFEQCYLSIEFNSLADAAGMKPYISITPEVAVTVEPGGRYDDAVTVRGDFVPGNIYTVELKAGLPAQNGASLAKDTSRTIQFPIPKASLRIDVPGRYLSPRGTLLVPVKAVGQEELTASIAPVYPNNLVMMAMREAYPYRFAWSDAVDSLTGGSVTQKYRLAAASGGLTREGAVDLRGLLGGAETGVYHLTLSGEKGGKDERLLVITDLGLSSRVFTGGALVWVNSLREAQPRPGVVVTMYSQNNQILARGETDADGLARLSWNPETEKVNVPFLIMAELDGDRSYIDLDRAHVDVETEQASRAYLKEGELEAMVFSDRGIYRPNETVFIQSLVRDPHMQAPAPFPAVLQIRRPDGRLFKEIPVMLDENGSCSTEVAMPDYLPTGRYSLELSMPGTSTLLGKTTISLEEFVPPQIRVKVDAETKRAPLGDTLVFAAFSEHLFGRPAAGLKATADITFTPIAFAPAAWKGWTFGDSQKDFADKHQQIGSGALDDEGRGQFRVETRATWQPPAALRAVCGVTVTENSGRTVTAYGSALVDPYPFYIALKPEWTGSIRVGDSHRVALAEVLPDGTAKPDAKPLALTLARVTWSSALRRSTQGRYEWTSTRHEETILEDTLAVSGDATHWTFSVKAAGDYTLIARDPASGSSTRIHFHAGDGDPFWSDGSRERPGHIEMTLDKKRSYRAGETVRLQVRTPFTGPGLLTIESDRVLKTQPVMLDKNTAEFEIAIEEAYAPNVYASLTMIRPAVAEAVWTTHRAVGRVSIPVERKNRRLQIELDAPDVIRPQTALTGRISARSENGQPPAQGTVTVIAVDEAICMLTAFQTPDPFKYFSAPRRLAVFLYDLYTDLIPLKDDTLIATPLPGGDGAGALRKRLNPIQANRFKPVALWQADVALDENGEAAFHLDVPEFTGELRLMAVAYNAAELGSAARPVKVKRDLIVQPSLPRFLAIDDTCQAVIPVYNESSEPMTVRLRVTCGGPLTAAQAEQQQELPAGGSTRFVVPLAAAMMPGKALCTIEVEGGAEAYRETIELAVRPAGGLRATGTNIVLQPGGSHVISAPAGWLGETFEATGLFYSSISIQWGAALDAVVNYPYGCLEQTTSGAFPLLYAADWGHELLPSSRALGDTDDFTRAAINRILSMQLEDGSFAMWPFSTQRAEEASIYAIHFLIEAKAAGHAVPPARLATALAWMRSHLTAALPADPGRDVWQRGMEQRAYIIYLLALAGQPDAAWVSRLHDNLDKLSYAGRISLAATDLLIGEPRRALPLLDSLPLPVTRPRIPGYLLNSDIRDAALLLSTWLEVDADNPMVATLAQYLAAQRRPDGDWGSTQDNAMALLALGKMERQLQRQTAPITGWVDAAGGRTAFGPTNRVEWNLPRGGATGFTLHNSGTGPLYAWFTLEGVSMKPEEPKTNGISIRRRYVDMENRPIPTDALAQGDLVIVKLHINTLGRRLDQLVIEDLLPAGWEIENANLQTSTQIPWIKRDESRAILSRDIRDDRILFFTGSIEDDDATVHYAIRAVTPGAYIQPPAVVSAMYEPELRGVSDSRRIQVLAATPEAAAP